MTIKERIPEIQHKLKEEKIDGWLLYDNHGSNRFVKELLQIPDHLVITRRLFYWIPAHGDPVKILHKIEENALDFLPGKKEVYLSWQELQAKLRTLLKDKKKVAMEYSPKNANPYISLVDAGTFEMVREAGVQVVSSADLIQFFTCVLDPSQIASHLKAAFVLKQTVERVWQFISENLRRNHLTEYDVQQFILKEFSLNGCHAEEGPTCAVNENSALPHYTATQNQTKRISKGDFILIDLWCKQDAERSVYADVTRVAVAQNAPTSRQAEIFDVVRGAQKKALALIERRMNEKQELQGFEVDDVCRTFIEEKGFGAYFPHRTGHNLGTKVHGAGVHFDNLETSDQRHVLPGMCFTIEPGIYLPEEFGIRLESNVLIEKNRRVLVTDDPQDSIVCLF